jgi:phosphatidylglycerol:prolipoprotein diacylglycerol transferase
MNWFALLLTVGVGLGMLRLTQASFTTRSGKDLFLPGAGYFTLLGSLAGARAAFVLFNPDYYSRHPQEILEVWRGGLHWGGAFPGALIVVILTALFWRKPLAQVADALSLLVPPMVVTAWLACWQGGCGCGAELPAGTWYALPVIDITGKVAPRFPLQMLAAVILLIFFLLIEFKLPAKSRLGLKACLLALVTGLVMLAASFFLAEPAPLWWGLRPDAWFAIGLAGLSLAGIGILYLPIRTGMLKLQKAWFRRYDDDQSQH